MDSLIEQAAQRMEQLRRAGVEVPGLATPEPVPAPEARLQPQPAPQAEPSPPEAPPPTSRSVELNLELIAASGILTPTSPRSQTSDEFRVVKRPLIANAIGKGAAMVTHGNLIMVTSAVAGEGKTFTSVNLAMSIAAELDHTVMLVDADVARPSVLRTLGLPAGPGLLDVLERKLPLSDALLRTNVPKLTLLPAGTQHPRATELLASESMSALLQDMATRYPDRIIIFDSPPLLLTTESRVLATHMGQIVVVVAAGKTPQGAVQQAIDTIENCPVRMLVLNRARGTAAGYGYGYGYGYGQAPAPESEQGKPGDPA